eukprot:TRINITY_DN41699_c0_g1_i1.p1 TRINITY_DN41699_c0_g1~~TRINITY_DN41699_c0_g1_i1.p1  ORF type:complete len:137 (+),score=20.05 TRINITY_DN41699_c0_g1_i1:71-481(+)
MSADADVYWSAVRALRAVDVDDSDTRERLEHAARLARARLRRQAGFDGAAPPHYFASAELTPVQCDLHWPTTSPQKTLERSLCSQHAPECSSCSSKSCSFAELVGAVPSPPTATASYSHSDAEASRSESSFLTALL